MSKRQRSKSGIFYDSVQSYKFTFFLLMNDGILFLDFYKKYFHQNGRLLHNIEVIAALHRNPYTICRILHVDHLFNVVF